MTSAWRLIVDGADTGHRNMALDEALLWSAARKGRATLRLYNWQGPWLSLGYAQNLEAGRRRSCERAGVGVVRRLTGGRAVLHGCDLTYAIAAPSERLPPGLQGSYALLAGALTEALQEIGLRPERARRGTPAPGPGVFDCFASAAADEIRIDGLKLAGSAQRRAACGVLQHGSIRIRPDPIDAARAAGLTGEGATSLAQAGCLHGEEALRDALVRALAKAVGALEPADLEPDELSLVEASNRRREQNPLYRPRLPSGISSQGHKSTTDTNL